MTRCPFCGSDEVYALLNTLRCKRCKGIWKVGEEDIDWTGSRLDGVPRPKNGRRIEPLEKRLAARLDECLARSGGRFCPDTMPWKAGEISKEIFLQYVRRCVTSRILTQEKDRSGRTWYRKKQ